MNGGFFDNYPEFLESHATNQVRLNNRHFAIIESNNRLIRGKKILDLASNDGRWSFAALKAGARHCVGVEGRLPFVTKANEIFRALNVSSDAYEFIHGDVFETLNSLGERQFDTVFLLGFLYHTLRYEELFMLIKRTGAKYLVIDTKVTLSSEPTIEVKVEEATPMNAMENLGINRNSIVVGWPSLSALILMLKNFNFDNISVFDWKSHLRDKSVDKTNHQVKLYERGERVTLICETGRAQI